MNFSNRILACFVICTGIFCCESEPRQTNEPKIELANSFGIDSIQLVYQYYQKYGFTDVCEDLRMVSRSDHTIELLKRLPINEFDLELINNFPNKIDVFNDTIILMNSEYRKQHQDIELDFVEYFSEEAPKIRLIEGSYEIFESDSISMLEIFDHESKLFYIEIHKCD